MVYITLIPISYYLFNLHPESDIKSGCSPENPEGSSLHLITTLFWLSGSILPNSFIFYL